MNSINFTIGSLVYTVGNATLGGSVINDVPQGGSSSNATTLYLRDPDTNALITQPAVVIIEEKDDNSAYHAMVVTSRISANKMGIGEVMRTWSNDDQWEELQTGTTNVVKEADLFGSLITLDKTSTDQYTAMISYPDEQVTSLVYLAENAASITIDGQSGGSGTGASTVTQPIVVTDSEVSSVSAKNLVVIGGSCINTVAAKLLGSETALCGADFTTKTGAGSGQYVIQTFESPYATTKIATLLTGY